MAKKQQVIENACKFCNAALDEKARTCSECGKYVVNDDALSIQVGQINKEMKDEGFLIFKVGEGDASCASLKRMPTGCLRIDKSLGGGIPYGARIEVAGPNQAGKSTFAMHVAAEVQKRGGRVLYVDVEQTFDPVYATTIGVDIDEMWYCKPNNGTLATDIIVKMFPHVQLIILDSIAVCAPNEQLLKENKKDQKSGETIDAHTIGSLAKLLTEFQPKLMKVYTSNPDCIILFINQVRDNMNIYSGEKYTMPGGKAKEHLCTARFIIDTSDTKNSILLDADGNYMGRKSRFIVKKWKYSFDRRNVEFEIRNQGIDRYSDLVSLGLEFGLLSKGGAWWQYKDKKFQGDENLRAALMEDEVFCEELEGEICNLVYGNGEVEDESGT